MAAMGSRQPFNLRQANCKGTLKHKKFLKYGERMGKLTRLQYNGDWLMMPGEESVYVA